MHGEKLRVIRVSRGLTQEDLAKKLQLTQNAYSKIENNKIRATEDQLKKLADVLSVSVEDIKNPDPIIINFHNSPQSSNNVNGAINYHENKELLTQLTAQLHEKDKQIEHLLMIIEKMKK